MKLVTSKRDEQEILELLALLRRTREGDSASEGWNRLVPILEPALRRRVHRHLVLTGRGFRSDLVSDLTQDGLLRLVRREARVLRGMKARSWAQLMTYLDRVARSTVIDYARRQRAQKRRAPKARDDQDELLGIHDKALLPDEKLLSREQLERLRRTCYQALEGSPTRERDVWIFDRAMLRGWSSREISRRLGIKPSSVDSVLVRLRNRLDRRGLKLPRRSW